MNTVKFKISGLQSEPDFALFIKDTVHTPGLKNSAKTAGKYIAFFKGDLAKHFFTDGIKFNPNEFFLCENELNLTEDRTLPYNMMKSAQKTKDKSSENILISDETEEGYNDDTALPSRKVSWRDPNRTVSSRSSFESGAHVYGKGSRKTGSNNAEAKKSKNKKKKDGDNQIRVDIVEDLNLPKPKHKRLLPGLGKSKPPKKSRRNLIN